MEQFLFINKMYDEMYKDLYEISKSLYLLGFNKERFWFFSYYILE